ncbi:N-acetylmuramoyl-L-alanine amidase family protein [Alkaliphilus sp. B6464]|uniref:N-acetylmuramoyl-L-alanine amidase family protein n=1 Tax=Alkaliphilus sp. B6464 TaxID=2731219 RepID=UPI001BA44B14|nr:N-acetylmuramoyl-L-alanine amidase [Alkaliphilus sp. B6464]QUH21407.1 N-acetylmuramoyl-L-alanine amidase [Alkaliphilus sp. B6464]
MKKYIVVLDPGHGGSDPGAVGPTGLKESHVAFKIACMVSDILVRYGIEIIFTRAGDTRVSLDERVRIANNSNVDYFVSIHINSATNPKATGTETFAYKVGVEGDRLAYSIQSNLVQAIGLADRGVKYNSLQVVRETPMPACLVEVAFINNPNEEQLLKSAEFLEKAAIGIAKGILEHIGIDYMPKEEEAMGWEEKQGLEHLENLVKKKIIDSPEFWKDKLTEPMPTWAILSLIDRITDK